MRTAVWIGSHGWTDAGVIADCIDGLRKPFVSILGTDTGFTDIVDQALAKVGLPRVVVAGNALDRIAVNPEGGFVIAGWDGKCRATRNYIANAESRGFIIMRLSYFGS